MNSSTKVSMLVFDGITALDAVGPYEVLKSVPGWEISFVGKESGEVRTDAGSLGLIADVAMAERPEADVLLVPGGSGNRWLLEDDETLDWVREVDRGTKWTTSVCTGSLVLGAAGLLDGRRATGHWCYLEPLRDFGASPEVGRWVEDGKYLNAAGVSAGIDKALHLVDREVAPHPPSAPGSPPKPPADLV